MWLVTPSAASPYSFRETLPPSVGGFGSPSTFTVCFHRIILFSITKKRPKPKKLFTCKTNFPVSNLFCINNVFSYSPFSIAIVKYPALINFTDFLNLEVPQQIEICSCCCCPLILFQKLREFDEKIIKKNWATHYLTLIFNGSNIGVSRS